MTRSVPNPPTPGKYILNGVAGQLESWDGVFYIAGTQEWEYLGATSASVSSVSPSTGPTTGGTIVTITGAGFTGTNTVKFGTKAAKFVFVSDSELTAISPSEIAGTVDITVITTNDGATASTTADAFTYATSVVPPLVFSPPSLENATVGNSANFSLSASGGTPPYAFSSPDLPPGLTINGSAVTGVPTTSGTFTSTVKAADSGAQTSTASIVFAVAASVAPPPPPPPPSGGLAWVPGTNTGSALSFPIDQGNPTQTCTVKSAFKNNLFVASVPTLTFNITAGSNGLPTEWETTDWNGVVISTGTVSGTTVSVPNPGKLGSFHLRFLGANVDANLGNAYGDCRFGIYQPDPNYPAIGGYTSGGLQDDPPATLVVGKGVWQTGSGGGADDALAAFTDVPFRLNFPLYGGTNPGQAQQTSDWQALATGYKAFIQTSLWLKNTDTTRPRQFVAAFPYFSGSAQDIACTTAAATILAGLPVVFEGYNEPNNDMSAANFYAIHQKFYAAVKAGAPNNGIIGPCTVTMNNASLSYIDQFLALKPSLDGFSAHCYNSVAQGNMSLGDNCLGQVVVMLEKYGYGSIPRYITEQGGFLVADYGPYFGRRQLSQGIRGMLQLERYGIPQQNQLWFCQTSHGDWANPSWISNSQRSIPGGGDLNPIGQAMHTMSEQLRGKAFSSEQSLGGAADFCKAYSFAGSAGMVLALFTSGSSALPATFSSSATMSAVDAFGNPVAITNGQLTITDLPTYINSTAAITVTDIDNGLMSATNTATGGTAAVAAGMTTTNVARINDGKLWSAYIDNSDDDAANSPYTDYKNIMPCSASVTFSSPQSVKRLALFFAPPWHQQTVPLEWSVEALVGGTWTNIYTYPGNPSATSTPFASFGSGCTYETAWDCTWIQPITLPSAVTCTALQIVVTQTSFGDAPDHATSALTAGSQGCPQRLVLNDLRAYSS